MRALYKQHRQALVPLYGGIIVRKVHQQSCHNLHILFCLEGFLGLSRYVPLSGSVGLLAMLKVLRPCADV